MNESDETLEQIPADNRGEILRAIAELSEKIGGLEKEMKVINNQLEVVREGIVHNSVSYDRLKAEVLMLRADVKELTEEVRHIKRETVA